jgi:ATP adenylyltransferase
MSQMPHHPGNNPTDPALGSAMIHAPWRLEYLESLGEKEKTAAQGPGPSGTGCFLRDYWLDPASDVRNHVIVRHGERDSPTGGMILLNAFPYANGHLLVALGEGRPRLIDYTPEQRAALWRLTDAAAALMETTLEPQGINFGINQGKAAGAGVPGHLHVHLVPRWNGDINFITVVGKVRVMPSSLEAMAERYRKGWERIRGQWEPLLS